MLTPAELRNRSFSKDFRGYNLNEVDDYISTVLDHYAQLYQENADLEKKLRLAVEQLERFKGDEQTIKETIVNAQKMADVIIQDANRKANGITGAVGESCEEILSEYRRKILIEAEAFREVKRAVDSFKQMLLGAYREHIESIKDKLEITDPDKTAKELVSEAIARAKEKMDRLEEEAQAGDREVLAQPPDAGDAEGRPDQNNTENIRPDFDAFESAKNESRNK